MINLWTIGGNATLFLAELDATKSLELSDDHIEFWQTARRFAIGGETISSSLLTKSVEGPVNLILGIATLAIISSLIYRLGYKTAKGGVAMVFIDMSGQAFWIVLAIFLLSNQYARLFDTVNGSWEFRNGLRNNTATVAMANKVFNESIANEIFNAQFGQELSEQLAVCQSLPFPTVRVPQVRRPSATEVSLPEGQTYDFIDCLETLEAKVKQDEANLRQLCGENFTQCEIIDEKSAELTKQVGDGIQRIRRRLVADLTSPIGNPILSRNGGFPEPLAIQADFSIIGDAISAALSGIGDFAFMHLAEGINNFYTTFVEISFLMWGLFAPITVAWSIIPGKRQIIGDWAIGWLALVITEQIYLIIVGLTAVMSSLPQFHEIGPRLFLFTFGISAPILAMGSGGVSGLALARTYRGTVLGAAGAAGSIVAGAAFSVLYKLNARKQLAR